MIYAFGEYELDTLTVELRRGREVVHVEPQVFGVLAHLIENRDRVVSKIELLDEVWPDRFVSESALTSRVQAARNACGDTGRDQSVIRTKHGRGYRFVAEVVEVAPDEPHKPDTAVPIRVPATGVPAAGVSATDIVGRDAELELLDTSIAMAVAGHRGTILVAGDAGIGKSTLVDTALERADGGGFRVLRAQCRPHRQLPEPYVSLLDALARFGRLHGEGVVDTIERVAPMWLTQLPSLVDPERTDMLSRRVLGGTRERMLREGVDLLEELSRSAPLVFVIEDLHWADPPTLEVVEWLARSRDDSPLLVIGTYRPGEDPTGELDAVASSLTVRGSARAVTIGPLDQESVRRLMIDRLEATMVDDPLVELAWAHSDGNPLFVAEEVAMWRRDEAIVVIDGTATAPRGITALRESVPEGVRQLIERGLERLDPDDVTLLEVASVVGRDFPAFAVAAGLGSAVETTEARLAALARRGRFVTAVGDDVWPDGTVSTLFRLSHDLHQQLLHDRIPTSRRAAIHQTIGERLEQAYGHRSDEHVVSLAQHFLHSGDSDRAVGHLQRAGELALARSAHFDAVGSLRQALVILENLPETEERDLREINIRASLGPALIATVGWLPDEVEHNYARALDLCSTMDPPPERFIVRHGLASVHELRGEYNRSEELLTEQLSDGAGLGVETKELLACSTFHQGAFGRSLDHARDALELWDPEQHSVFMARYGEHPGVSANTWGSLSAWYLGEPELSLEMARQAIDWGSVNEYALSTAQIQFAFLHQYRDEPERCRWWADETIRLAESQGFPFRAAQARVLIGWCTAAQGDPEAGIEELRVGLETYRTFGARMDEPYFLGLLADAEIRAGRVDDALGHLDEGVEVINDTTRSFFYEPELDRMRAVALIAGDGPAATAEAAAVLDRAAATAKEHRSTALELRIAVTRMELGLAQGNDTTNEIERLLSTYDHDIDIPDVDRARQLVSGRS